VKVTLSVIVPAYNEERRIRPLLDDLVTLKEQAPDLNLCEIIVVDDGSTDGTAQVLQEYGERVRVIRHGKNMGKGAAVKTGIAAAEGGYILFMDADGATPASEIPKMVSALERFDFVSGARNARGSRMNAKRPIIKRVTSRLFNFYVRRLFKTRNRDILCGFKGMRKGVAKRLAAAIVSDGWIFDAEMLARAKAMGARIAEIPIEWGYVKGSNMRLGRETAFAVFRMMKLRKRLRREGVVPRFL